MNYGELPYEVPNDLRRLYRALERYKKKMTSLTWSCTFYKVCLQENFYKKNVWNYSMENLRIIFQSFYRKCKEIRFY